MNTFNLFSSNIVQGFNCPYFRPLILHQWILFGSLPLDLPVWGWLWAHASRGPVPPSVVVVGCASGPRRTECRAGRPTDLRRTRFLPTPGPRDSWATCSDCGSGRPCRGSRGNPDAGPTVSISPLPVLRSRSDSAVFGHSTLGTPGSSTTEPHAFPWALGTTSAWVLEVFGFGVL